MGEVNVFGSRLDKPFYGCGMMDAVRRAFLKYAIFSGRASRGEFWWWWLFQLLVGIGVTVLAVMLMLAGLPNPLLIIFIVVPYIIWNLVTLVPNLAVTVRRLHDTNKSGWLVLIPAVPWLINFVASLPDTLEEWRQTYDSFQIDRVMAQMNPEEQAEFVVPHKHRSREFRHTHHRTHRHACVHRHHRRRRAAGGALRPVGRPVRQAGC